MKNKYTTDRKVTTFILLVILIILSVTQIVTPSGVLGDLYSTLGQLANVGLLGSLGITVVILGKKGRYSLTKEDLIRIARFGLIAIGLSTLGFLPVLSLLFYEKLPYALANSPYRNYLDGVGRKSPFKQFLYTHIKQPLSILLVINGIGSLAMLPVFLKVYFATSYNIRFFNSILLLAIPTHLILLAIYSYAAYQVGGNIQSLLILPGRETESCDSSNPYTNPLQNFRWMMLAFVVASPTIWLSLPYLPEFLSQLLSITDALKQVDYALYATSSTLIFTLRPLIQQIVQGSLWYRYCALENICPKDFNDMYWNERVRFAILSGIMFAFTSPMTFISTSSFINVFCMGMVNSMLTTISGSIDLACIHLFLHNMSHMLFPTFCCLWYRYPVTQYITPWVSSFIKSAAIEEVGYEYYKECMHSRSSELNPA